MRQKLEKGDGRSEAERGWRRKAERDKQADGGGGVKQAAKVGRKERGREKEASMNGKRTKKIRMGRARTMDIAVGRNLEGR
eukprot:2810227-Pleurochrysis_carterae.AAC.1